MDRLLISLCIALGQVKELLEGSELFDLAYNINEDITRPSIKVSISVGPDLVLQMDFYSGTTMYETVKWFTLGYSSAITHSKS